MPSVLGFEPVNQTNHWNDRYRTEKLSIAQIDFHVLRKNRLRDIFICHALGTSTEFLRQISSYTPLRYRSCCVLWNQKGTELNECFLGFPGYKCFHGCTYQVLTICTILMAEIYDVQPFGPQPFIIEILLTGFHTFVWVLVERTCLNIKIIRLWGSFPWFS